LQKNYRPELDGVRAICILLTIANHLPGAPGFINGSVGVDIFFALSGWLITHLLLQERVRTGTISLRSFYLRRVFRIAPLYFVSIALYGLAALAMAQIIGSSADLQSFMSAFPWLITFNSEYRGEDAGNIFGHAWTLGIEEKFYILWPIFLLLFIRNIRLPLLLLPAVIVALIAWAPEKDHVLRGYLGLGFGTALAIAAQNASVAKLLGQAWAVYAAAILIALCYVLSLLFPHAYFWNIAVSLAAAFLVGGLWHGDSHVGRLLSWQPLAYAGKLTFAVYLTHVLVINVVVMALQKTAVSLPYAAVFVLVYASSILVAAVLNAAVEDPLIKVGRRVSARDKPVALTAAETVSP
jgi:peptidoglycan/LPS O-acetylase OafA/YrhL